MKNNLRLNPFKIGFLGVPCRFKGVQVGTVLRFRDGGGCTLEAKNASPTIYGSTHHHRRRALLNPTM